MIRDFSGCTYSIVLSSLKLSHCTSIANAHTLDKYHQMLTTINGSQLLHALLKMKFEGYPMKDNDYPYLIGIKNAWDEGYPTWDEGYLYVLG